MHQLRCLLQHLDHIYSILSLWFFDISQPVMTPPLMGSSHFLIFKQSSCQIILSSCHGSVISAGWSSVMALWFHWLTTVHQPRLDRSSFELSPSLDPPLASFSIITHKTLNNVSYLCVRSTRAHLGVRRMISAGQRSGPGQLTWTCWIMTQKVVLQDSPHALLSCTVMCEQHVRLCSQFSVLLTPFLP